MGPEERDPDAMIRDGMLERIEDFEHKGNSIPASRLGYRITRRFVRTYLARVFDNPSKVFTDEILKPELQDMDSYADGILHIAEAQKKVANVYMSDGGYELACPPLRAVLSVLATGSYEGKGIEDPEVRSLFTRESLLKSDWYQRRLGEKQYRDQRHWDDAVKRLESFISEDDQSESVIELNLAERLAYAKEQQAKVATPEYMQSLQGTIGADPMRVDPNAPELSHHLANSQSS